MLSTNFPIVENRFTAFAAHVLAMRAHLGAMAAEKTAKSRRTPSEPVGPHHKGASIVDQHGPDARWYRRSVGA